MEGLILILEFQTEDPDGMVDVMNIIFFLEFSISSSSEVALITNMWYMALDGIFYHYYTDSTTILQKHKVDSIMGWEASGAVDSDLHRPAQEQIYAPHNI